MPLGSRRLALVTLFYLALTLILSYPFPLHLTDRMLAAGSDPQFWLWTLSWDTHALTHRPWALFDANIFYPGQHTLAYSENLLGSALLATPVIWLSHNPVLALNLVELASIVLSALGTYVLARRVGLRHTSAVLAGMVFAFAPARFLRITQFHLTTIQWLPFGLAFLYSYLHGGRKTDLRLFVLFFSLQALTSGHGAVFLQLSAALLVVYRLAQGEPFAIRKRVSDLGIPGALLLLPSVLMFLAYEAAKTEVPALARTLDDFGVSTASYFASPSHLQKLVLSHAPAWMTTPEADAYLFQGYLPILLSLVAIGWRGGSATGERVPAAGPWWRRAGWLLEVVALVTVAAGAYVVWTGATRVRIGDTMLLSARHPSRIWIITALALGLRFAIRAQAPIDVAGRCRRFAGAVSRWWRARRGDPATPFVVLTVVSAWLTLGPPFGLWQWVYWLPALSFLRVPSRFVMLELLGLAILASFGFERLTSRWSSRRRAMGAIVIGGLLVGEFAAMPLVTEPFTVDPPAIDRWLDTQPKPFVVAEVPMPRTWSPAVVAIYNARYMLHSTAHWQKTVHGFSGVEPAMHTKLFLQMARFPDDESVRALTDLGVTYLVMHTESYRGTELAAVEARLERYADWVSLIHVEGSGRVYTLHKPQ